MNKLENLLRLAGALQLALLTASALVPGVLDWRRNLALLHPFLRSLFWVYGAFIVLVISGFGILTLLDAGAMAAGQPVARSLAALIGLFWLARLAVQCFVFDCGDFLKNRFLALGYHCLTVVFIYLALVLGWAALAPTAGRVL
ncbi:MAG TPA: hypothetical protein VHY22_08110 [Chthoniobacteraceae bacterium]|jgi:hypothetical protein|nr:hypothetical protein [Chthoniobacteraceae bacterium]